MSVETTIRKILSEAKTIAVVGWSPKAERPSFGVSRYLASKGFRMIAVNPGQAGGEAFGAPIYASLTEAAKAETIDMVDVFRRSEEAGAVIDEAISIGAKAVWLQLGVSNPEGEARAKAAGLDVVSNRCPAIEIPRLGL